MSDVISFISLICRPEYTELQIKPSSFDRIRLVQLYWQIPLNRQALRPTRTIFILQQIVNHKCGNGDNVVWTYIKRWIVRHSLLLIISDGHRRIIQEFTLTRIYIRNLLIYYGVYYGEGHKN